MEGIRTLGTFIIEDRDYIIESPVESENRNWGLRGMKVSFLDNWVSQKTSFPDDAFVLRLYTRDNTVTVFNYIPLSEARKVALYILFFTFGDSLSKTAMVVICPFTGSIFSQLAGSDNFVYLQNKSTISLIFFLIGFIPKATSSLTYIFGDTVGHTVLTWGSISAPVVWGGISRFCLHEQACRKHDVSVPGKRTRVQSPYCELGLMTDVSLSLFFCIWKFSG